MSCRGTFLFRRSYSHVTSIFSRTQIAARLPTLRSQEMRTNADTHDPGVLRQGASYQHRAALGTGSVVVLDQSLYYVHARAEAGACGTERLQGYLAHEKEPPPLRTTIGP